MVPVFAGFAWNWRWENRTFVEPTCFSDPPACAIRRHERKDLEAKVWEARSDLKLREKAFSMNQAA